MTVRPGIHTFDTRSVKGFHYSRHCPGRLARAHSWRHSFSFSGLSFGTANRSRRISRIPESQLSGGAGAGALDQEPGQDRRARDRNRDRPLPAVAAVPDRHPARNDRREATEVEHARTEQRCDPSGEEGLQGEAAPGGERELERLRRCHGIPHHISEGAPRGWRRAGAGTKTFPNPRRIPRGTRGPRRGASWRLPTFAPTRARRRGSPPG